MEEGFGVGRTGGAEGVVGHGDFAADLFADVDAEGLFAEGLCGLDEGLVGGCLLVGLHRVGALEAVEDEEARRVVGRLIYRRREG